jgi:formamidopyrimidine-DNA glycosylase
MPELPDVEVYKQYMDATSLHKKVDSLEVREKRVLDGVSARKLAGALTGNSLRETRRHGKYLFASISGGSTWLVLHFGMTGSLAYFKEPEGDRRHDRVLFHFENGYTLAYVSQRLLGGVGLTGSVEGFVSEKGMGPDAFALHFEAFRDIVARGRGTVKSTLMNQKLIAGIGNIYSDEILFQAGVHPGADVRTLSGSRLRAIYDSMFKVMETAIERRTDPAEFPDWFIIPRRREGGTCPRCGGKVKTVKISGRTAYFCPTCQGKR